MFQWHKEMDRIEIDPVQLLALHRSLGEAQISLPGVGVQAASAYLCGYPEGRGCQVAVVLHLRDGNRLAVYLNQPGPVPRGKLAALLQQGQQFIETMGFFLEDLEVTRQSPAQRQELWAALPLRGLPAAEETPGALPSAAGATDVAQDAEPEVIPPSAEDLQLRRRELRANMGRFFASL